LLRAITRMSAIELVRNISAAANVTHVRVNVVLCARAAPSPAAQSGYPCLSLHGGKDQSDRESTISDFKSNVCNVLVATSIAARGLDVKDLVRYFFSRMRPRNQDPQVPRPGRCPCLQT